MTEFGPGKPVLREKPRADPVRAFFAIWPDVPAGAALATLSRDVAARLHGRATAAGNLHVTLAFLGDTNPARIVDLDAIGAAVAATVSPFALALDRIGTFRGAGIAWAGTSAPPAELVRLAESLGDALGAADFPTDRRPFHAHVTLARRCRSTRSDPLAPPIAWTVTRLTLNASELSSGAPRYRELAGWPIGG